MQWGWWDVQHCVQEKKLLTCFSFQPVDAMIRKPIPMEYIPKVTKDWVMSSFADFDRVLNYNIQSQIY